MAYYLGTLTATYDELVECFGIPRFIEKDCSNETDVEWEVAVYDRLAYIYNYKDGKNCLGEEGKHFKEITEWKVGGPGHSSIFEYIEHEIKETRKHSNNINNLNRTSPLYKLVGFKKSPEDVFNFMETYNEWVNLCKKFDIDRFEGSPETQAFRAFSVGYFAATKQERKLKG